MDHVPGQITLTKKESELLLEFFVRALGRKRTKPGSTEYDVHQKVWDAWSDLHAGDNTTTHGYDTDPPIDYEDEEL